MVKSLVFHIGDPKTGSSSIQSVLYNRQFESPGIKVDYPDQLNSYPLAHALRHEDKADHEAPRFRKLARWAAASEADVAVISSEQFSRVDPADLQRAITRYLPKHAASARVIAYVRPHASRLLSTYMQRTKVGLLQCDIASYFLNARQDSLMLCAARFRGWRAVFGDRFILRPMIRSELQDGDVVADFLNTLLQGASFTLLSKTQTNPSLTLEGLAGIREVQGVLGASAVASRTRHAVGSQLGRILAGLPDLGGTRLRMTPAVYEQLRILCRPDAADLDREFFQRPVMRRELKAAAAETIAENLDTDPRLHFTPETLQALRQYARALVRLFQLNPNAWTDAFEWETGKAARRDPESEKPGALQLRVQEVGRVLTAIAMTIAERKPVALADPGLNAPVMPAKSAGKAAGANAAARGKAGRAKGAAKPAGAKKAAKAGGAAPARKPRRRVDQAR